MLSRSKRLSKIQFDEVFKKGRVLHSPIFVFKILGGQKDSRFSVVFSKKIVNTATKRNSLRRKTYNSIRHVFEKVTDNHHGIFIGKKDISDLSLIEIQNDIKNLFVKSGLLK